MHLSHADDEIHVMCDDDDTSLRRTFSYTEQATNTVTKLFTLSNYSNAFQNRFHVMSFAAFIAYLLIGLGYYMGHQDYDFVDSMYFSVVTILTIGYGDLEPVSSAQRVFTSFYVLMGLLIMTAVISAVTDKIHQNYLKRSDERVKRAAYRMRNVKAQEVQRNSLMDFLEVGEGVENEGGSFSKNLSERLGLSNNRDYEQADKKIVEALQKLNVDMFDEDLQDLKISALRNIALMWIIIFFGCLIMLEIEDWNFGDSYYWAIVTITTVGFGDMVPHTDKGKVFTIFYGLLGVAVVARIMNDLISYPLVKKEKQSELKVMMQFGGELSEETLRHILANDFFDRVPNLRQNKDSISKSEFILLVLGMMNKLNDKDIIIVSKIFEMLDKHQDGVLSSDTLRREITTARLQEEKDTQLQEILSGDKQSKSLGLGGIHSKLKEKVGDIKGSVTKKSKKTGAYEKVGSQGMSNPLIDEVDHQNDDLSEHSSNRGTYNLSIEEGNSTNQKSDSY